MYSKINIINSIYKIINAIGARKNDSFFQNIVDEQATKIIVDKIPNQLSFFEKRKWLKHKENILFSDKNFVRLVDKNYCTWLYSDLTFSRWSILEKMKSLRSLVKNITESEIWFFDDGKSKLCFTLFNGLLVSFKLLNEFSDQVLDNLIQSMKKYSFQSPVVRAFNCNVDFSYKVKIYSCNQIETKLNTSIDKMQHKYISDLISNIKCGIVNVLCLSFSLLAFSIYQYKQCGLFIKEKNMEHKMSLIKNQLSNYPDVHHVEILNKNVQRKINLSKFVSFVRKYDYKLIFNGKNKIILKIHNLTIDAKGEILNKSIECGIAEVEFS